MTDLALVYPGWPGIEASRPRLNDRLWTYGTFRITYRDTPMNEADLRAHLQRLLRPDSGATDAERASAARKLAKLDIQANAAQETAPTDTAPPPTVQRGVSSVHERSKRGGR